MEDFDQLLLITEVSVALAGFAGVVAAFQHREGTPASRGETLGIAMMVNIGLVAACFYLLPQVLTGLGVSLHLSWRISSGLMFLNYLVFYYYIIRNMRGVKVRKASSKLVYSALYFMGLVFLVVNAMNALTFGFEGVRGPFFASLVLPLVVAGYMFARLVLRPLWRSVRLHEERERESSWSGHTCNLGNVTTFMRPNPHQQRAQFARRTALTGNRCCARYEADLSIDR